ncbi:hypothetical protein LR48_Vigan252s004900 [Vigna angularis]|uniref:Uncharacterized protein n=1 Tax=Phaseolus angularis TaxID=3914 RepID=A0A0L9T6X8_PHAAN|nr:hypothetical protein LR48_Vigan252s004900 [Vigna angularis]
MAFFNPKGGLVTKIATQRGVGGVRMSQPLRVEATPSCATIVVRDASVIHVECPSTKKVDMHFLFKQLEVASQQKPISESTLACPLMAGVFSTEFEVGSKLTIHLTKDARALLEELSRQELLDAAYKLNACATLMNLQLKNMSDDNTEQTKELATMRLKLEETDKRKDVLATHLEEAQNEVFNEHQVGFDKALHQVTLLYGIPLAEGKFNVFNDVHDGKLMSIHEILGGLLLSYN